MTSCLSQLKQKILPLGKLGSSRGKRSPQEPRGPPHGQCALSYQGADAPHPRRRNLVTVTAINYLVTIGQGEGVRPGVHPGRPFGNSGRQGWAPDWHIGLEYLQKDPSESQDRSRQSNTQHVSARSRVLY